MINTDNILVDILPISPHIYSLIDTHVIFTCCSPACKLCNSFEVVCLGHLSMSE